MNTSAVLSVAPPPKPTPPPPRHLAQIAKPMSLKRRAVLVFAVCVCWLAVVFLAAKYDPEFKKSIVGVEQAFMDLYLDVALAVKK